MTSHLESFFYTDPLTDEYRALLKAADPSRTPPHLFMLLIDEIVVRILQQTADVDPGFVMSLDDAAVLGEETPFSLRGRQVFQVWRNSRMLQAVRGTAYYVTFGFWPENQAPTDYLSRTAPMWRPGQAGLAGPQVPAALSAVLSARPLEDTVYEKTFPPVLPGQPGQPPRTFASLDDYRSAILVSGEYRPDEPPPGRLPPDRPPPPPAPWSAQVQRVQPGPETNAMTIKDLVSRPAPVDVEDVSIEGVVFRNVTVKSSSTTVWFRGGLWRMDINIQRKQANVKGPARHVGLLLTLARALAWSRGGTHLQVTWTIAVPRAPVLVAGTEFQAHRYPGFLVAGADALLSRGFVPKSMVDHRRGNRGDGVAQLPEIIALAQKCQQTAGRQFVAAGDPRFDDCARVAWALGSDVWVGPVEQTARTGVVVDARMDPTLCEQRPDDDDDNNRPSRRRRPNQLIYKQ